jgi:hypothetical protein
VLLECKTCGEKRNLRRCQNGIRRDMVDRSGKTIIRNIGFEPMSSEWYECAACGSADISFEGGVDA